MYESILESGRAKAFINCAFRISRRTACFHTCVYASHSQPESADSNEDQARNPGRANPAIAPPCNFHASFFI